MRRRIQDHKWENVYCVTANNINENISKVKYVGTCTITMGHVASTVKKFGIDPTGLVRWTWIRLVGKNEKAKIIITAYSPCKSSNVKPSTVYSQHRRYWI